MLYVISTPIGNLEDITLRALRVMSLCDYILCEDTRKSGYLLRENNIKTPLKSFHKFNETKLLPKIIQDLKQQKTIGLISDAGTPLISDPGLDLIKNCQKENILITALPGACSVIQAAVLSACDSIFQFIGFLPKKEKQLKEVLTKALFYSGATIFFETAKRIEKTLKTITLLDPQRKVSLLREMTKKFEENKTALAKEHLEHFAKVSPKGEFTVVIHKGVINKDLELDEILTLLQEEHGLSLKEAIKLAAKMTKSSKNKLYSKNLKQSKQIPTI